MLRRKVIIRCIEMAAVEYLAYETIAAVGDVIKNRLKKKEKGDTVIFKQNGKVYEVVL